MSSEEPELTVAAEDNETVIICNKCGKEFNMAFETDLDLEEDSDLYKELLNDHEFMCSSDFPDFEVKEKSCTKYVEKNDAEEAIKEARGQERQKILDKLDDIEQRFHDGDKKTAGTLKPSKLVTEVLETVEEELRDELEEEVDQS